MVKCKCEPERAAHIYSFIRQFQLENERECVGVSVYTLFVCDVVSFVHEQGARVAILWAIAATAATIRRLTLHYWCYIVEHEQTCIECETRKHKMAKANELL